MKLASMLATIALLTSTISMAQTYKECSESSPDIKVSKEGVQIGSGATIRFSRGNTLSYLHPYTQTIKRYRKYSKTIPAQYKYSDVVELVECNGTCSNWNRFYNLDDKDLKIKALAKTVKGIGEARATIIHSSNVFKTGANKPKSWKAFVNVMKNLESNNSDLKGLVADILTHEKDNKLSLGYAKKASVRKKVKVADAKTIIEKAIISNDSNTDYFKVNLSADLLPLSGETESIKVKMRECDGKGYQIDSPDKLYTASAQGTFSNATIKLRRNRVNPGNIFSFNSSLVGAAGSLKIENFNLRHRDLQVVLADLKRNGGSILISGSAVCESDIDNLKGHGSVKKDQRAADALTRQQMDQITYTTSAFNTGLSLACDYKVNTTLNVQITGSSYFNTSSSSKEISTLVK